jgi:DNA-directed RNA polymerase specialized sigma subunit
MDVVCKTDYCRKLDYLSSYQWRMREVNSMRDRIADMEKKIDALEDKLTEIPAQQISDMPKGGKPQDMGDLIAAKLDLMDAMRRTKVAYERDLAEAEALRVKVYDYIRSAESISDRTILAMHYVDGMSYAHIARVLGFSDRQIKRICKNAVHNLSSCP